MNYSVRILFFMLLFYSKPFINVVSYNVSTVEQIKHHIISLNRIHICTFFLNKRAFGIKLNKINLMKFHVDIFCGCTKVCYVDQRKALLRTLLWWSSREMLWAVLRIKNKVSNNLIELNKYFKRTQKIFCKLSRNAIKNIFIL